VINSYTLRDGRLVTQPVTRKEQLTADCLWIDLEKPADEELHWICEVYGQQLPTMDTLVEIEASSRFFQDESGLHVRSYFLHEIPEQVSNVTVAFVLNKGRLFTLRDETLKSFHHYGQLLEMQKGLVIDAFGIMLGLFETKVDRLADLLEQLHVDLEVLSARVFHAEELDFDEVLTILAASQDKNDKARLSLMDKQRALSYLLRSKGNSEEELSLLHEILRDIRSLDEHSTFLFEKVQFLMDVTIGRINIEQNKIIKVFSIAAVVFLPPTLIASIYGMNFHLMPEFSWSFGYPLALLLMIAAGIAPYWYFKRKKWF
jgi:magnesium transporter